MKIYIYVYIMCIYIYMNMYIWWSYKPSYNWAGPSYSNMKQPEWTCTQANDVWWKLTIGLLRLLLMDMSFCSSRSHYQWNYTEQCAGYGKSWEFFQWNPHNTKTQRRGAPQAQAVVSSHERTKYLDGPNRINAIPG
jgi:hypothetical protein